MAERHSNPDLFDSEALFIILLYGSVSRKWNMLATVSIIITFLIFYLLPLVISHQLELWRCILSPLCESFCPDFSLTVVTLPAPYGRMLQPQREPELSGSSSTKPSYMESWWFTISSRHRNGRISWAVESIETCTKPTFTLDLCHLGQTTDNLSEATDQTF